MKKSLGQSLTSCPIRRDGDVGYFYPRQGVRALEYLQKRTRDDPFFAIASGFMHAGQINYRIQQAVVERLVADPDREALLSTPEGAKTMLLRRYTGSQMTPGKIEGWPYVMDCWKKYCKTPQDPSGRACVSPPPGEPGHGKLPARAILMMRCLRNLPSTPGAGIGPKSRNLLAEYLGCEHAVAVDRHVGNFVANSAGTLAWAQNVYFFRRQVDPHGVPLRDERGHFLPLLPCKGVFSEAVRGSKPVCTYTGRVVFAGGEDEKHNLRHEGIPAVGVGGGGTGAGGTFAMLKREIGRLARSCGLKSAQMQVGAWLQGVCDSALKEEGRTDLYLGKDATFDCTTLPRLKLGPPAEGFALTARLPSPGWAFRCRPDYLGGAARPVNDRPRYARPVKLVSGPVRAPHGVKLHFDSRIFPVVPGNLLPFWGMRRPERPRPRLRPKVQPWAPPPTWAPARPVRPRPVVWAGR